MIDPKAINEVLELFLPTIKLHSQTSARPFILGLSGLQGSGKSTWAAALSNCLTSEHGLKTRIISLDDLYHDHAQLITIREANPGNGLLQTRGQPGTHDEELARSFFNQVKDGSSAIQWPSYDKSLHSGEGGRVPMDEWEIVPKSEKLDVLIFEGWCLGFKPVTAKELDDKWKRAKDATSTQEEQPIHTLADHDLCHLKAINENLKRYNESFTGPQFFNGFLHLSTDKLNHVYQWRLDQERALRKHKPGMTDDRVVQFVRGYMPAYELFLERLQHENFFAGFDTEDPAGKHVQIILNQDREVIQLKVID
ncbi:kinase [Paramyrothecium foliicola]|nr:kinase [Paramyrothecium foliicola]